MAFAAPHQVLQECVGVALVTEPGTDLHDCSVKGLQRFAAVALHPSKWPQLVVLMDGLPKSATGGKLLRVRFAQRCDLPELSDALAPEDRFFAASAPPVGAPLGTKIALRAVKLAVGEPETAKAVAVDIEGAGVSEATYKQVNNMIAGVTGGRASPHDHLVGLGIDSLNLLELSRKLQQVFNAPGLDLFLVGNPSVAELCSYLESGDSADAQTMNIPAVFGLRSFLQYWIIRNHIALLTAFTGDVLWGDMAMIWRTNIFIFLYGMTMAMEYDKEEVSTRRLIKNFAPMLPVYYVCLALHYPITVSCESWNIPDENKPANVFGALFLLQSVSPSSFSLMGHAWTLSAILLFTLLFKPLRRCMQYCRMCDAPEPESPKCCAHGCCLFACCCCETPGMARRLPTKTLGQFTRRLAKWSIYPTLTTFFVFVPYMYLATHFWFPCQLTRFFLGMIVGEAVLHVRMDDATEKTCGRWTDAICFACFVISFAFPLESYDLSTTAKVAYLFHNFPVAYVLFGLCRSKYSHAAKFFSLEIFTGFTKYTYAAYLLHIPLIGWGQFARVKGFQRWLDVFNYDYGANTCYEPDDDQLDDLFAPNATNATSDEPDDDKPDDLFGPKATNATSDEPDDDKLDGLCAPNGRDWDAVPWPFYISAFCVTLVGAVLLTMLVHEPFQRFWNKYTSHSEVEHDEDPQGKTTTGRRPSMRKTISMHH